MGEQPLLPYESCNLGSINLVNMLSYNKNDGEYVFDHVKFKSVVKTAVRFLDNVIDANVYPIKEIEVNTKKYRKIGLGVMGFADMLYLMKVPYTSDDAINIAKDIAKKLTEYAREYSVKLAIEKGSFSGITDGYDYHALPNANLDNVHVHSAIRKGHLRNALTTTIAPTGSISVIASVSSGIEPNFSLAYIRNVTSLNNEKYQLMCVNGIFSKALAKELNIGVDSDEYNDIINKVIDDRTVSNIPNLSDKFKSVFVAANGDDIHYKVHVMQQCAWQEYIDNAISKTVNCPNNITPEDVETIYNMAYRNGAKGITIYRDGSRDSQVLVSKKLETKSTEVPTESVIEEAVESTTVQPSLTSTNNITVKDRPDVLQGFTFKIKSGCGNLLVTINYDDDGICEIITNTGKSGGCASQSEATARIASIALRAGVPIEEVIDQFKGIRCMSAIRRDGIKVTSCPDAIAKCILRAQEMLKTGNTNKQYVGTLGCTSIPVDRSKIQSNLCPKCGNVLEHEGGCNICRSCGYSKCGGPA